MIFYYLSFYLVILSIIPVSGYKLLKTQKPILISKRGFNKQKKQGRHLPDIGPVFGVLTYESKERNIFVSYRKGKKQNQNSQIS